MHALLLGPASILLAAQSTFLDDTPSWEVTGTEPWQETGAVVRKAGDVDGDSISDLLIFSPGSPAQAGVHGRGMVQLFRGRPEGFETTPAWTLRGSLGNEPLDRDVAGAGDVNGDGFDDLVFSSSFTQVSPPTGAVYVFLGGPQGPNGGQDALLHEADWIAEGALPGDGGFGHALLGPGDVTGDGFDDLVVGCYYHTSADGMHIYEGAVYLFPGSAAGLPISGGARASVADASWMVESDATHGYLGQRLHEVGDVDGDGFIDFAATASAGPQDPVAFTRHFVFRGGPGGPPPGLAGAFGSIAGTIDSGAMGKDLAAADFNLDGYVDLAVAFPGRNYQGFEPIELHLGHAGGFVRSIWRWHESWYEGSGVSLTAGDFDGDGRADLAVASSNYTAQGGGSSTGRVRVFRGQTAAHGDGALEPTFVWEWVPGTAGGGRFLSVEAVGDPESDGTDTLALGLARDDVGGLVGAGRVVLFGAEGQGGDDGCPFAEPDWVFDGEPKQQSGMWSTIGDFDADGYDDVLVGRKGRYQGEGQLRLFFGAASGLSALPAWQKDLDHPSAVYGAWPAGAGDVNGDGYDDALVLLTGDWYYPGFRYTPGVAFVFHGGPNGLDSTPAWSARPITQAPLHFAYSGSIVGDVNGDGFDDVAIGAYGHQQMPPMFGDPYDVPGSVHVWYGSPGGVNGGVAGTETNADWTAVHPDTSGDFGRTVKSAGDLDGDGCEELLVAAPLLDVPGVLSGGALYLWHGSPNGLNDGVDGQPLTNASWRVNGTEPGGVLGLQFDAGVDLNADGVPDLVTRRTDLSLELGVDLRSGTPFGFGPVAMTIERPDERGFGHSFGLLEDFDGDGYGDLAVSAPRAPGRVPGAGRIHLFRGGPAGVSPAALWRAAGDKIQVRLGSGWLMAHGDVNGDGKSDLLSGTPHWYDQAEAELRGRFVVWYGSDAPLLQLTPARGRTGDSIAVGHQGGAAHAPVLLGAVARDGVPLRFREHRLAIGQTDSDGCWLVDWVIPSGMEPGTWTLETRVLVPPSATGGGWSRSQQRELVVR